MKAEKIMRLIKNRIPRPEGKYQVFGVMAPLIETAEGYHMLLEIRASTLRRQPGEISLPGGMKEEGETPVEAAVRETSEELSIPKAGISVLGPLDYLVTPFNNTIYPFVGIIEQAYLSHIKGAPNEVEEVFTVPLDFFLSTRPQCYQVGTKFEIPREFPFGLIPNGTEYNWRSGIYPVYFYSYKRRIIWGITARILKNLADILNEGNSTV